MKREAPVNAEKVGRMSKTQQQFKVKYIIKNTTTIAYKCTVYLCMCVRMYTYVCVRV